MSADRNLLFGILAVQLDFVSKDALLDAMSAWLLDKAKPLGVVLRDRGSIDTDTHTLLDALVRRHVAQHGDSPTHSLAALSPVEPALRLSIAAVADDEVRHTLLQVAAARQEIQANCAATQLQPPSAAPTPGMRYRILRPHARGGLGEVFVAEDTELGRQVALKEIQGRYADDVDCRNRFVKEAEITGGLEHPGIVPIYGLGTYADGRPYYAMRFIKGDTLHDAITRFHASAPDFHSLAFRELLGQFVDVCNAIAYAHSRGILHRDLKPSNVMLGKYGETLVVDWGLAKVAGRPDGMGGEVTLRPNSSDEASVTVAGQALGTPAYMSPEQADGRVADLGPATDVYSLGATLYELLTGKVPFVARTIAELLEAVKAGRFPAPHAIRAAVPRGLEAVCLKAMALRPADRYPSAADVAREAECWLADEPVSAYAEPFGARARRWMRRHRGAVAAAAAVLPLLTAALAVSTVLVGRERNLARQRAAEARRHFRQAREAVDYFAHVSMEELADAPRSHRDLRRRMLVAALDYYKEFLCDGADDPALKAELEQAQERASNLLAELLASEQGAQVVTAAALARTEVVRAELRVTAEQGRRLDELLPTVASGKPVVMLPPGRKIKDDLAAILTPEQNARLKQITMQVRGAEAMLDHDVAADLRLTEEQARQVRLHARPMIAVTDGMVKRGTGLPKAMEVLTPDQRAAWEKLVGPPFMGTPTLVVPAFGQPTPK